MSDDVGVVGRLKTSSFAAFELVLDIVDCGLLELADDALLLSLDCRAGDGLAALGLGVAYSGTTIVFSVCGMFRKSIFGGVLDRVGDRVTSDVEAGLRAPVLFLAVWVYF